MSGDTVIWLDGQETQGLPLPDRGLDFGDGVFETLLVNGNQPLFSHLHLSRMQRGCRLLAFPDCLDSIRKYLATASAAIADRGWQWASLRITLTRGEGPRGYVPLDDPHPRVIISATRLADTASKMAPPASLHLARIRWSTQPALAGLKHLNRLEQVLAAQEYRNATTDEAVMLDQDGRVISVVTGNLFLVTGAQILTPRLDHCGIWGTRRELIMQRWAPALGLEARETDLSLEQLETADEAFYSNSLLGVRPVASFGQRRWVAHPVCEALHGQYLGDLA